MLFTDALLATLCTPTPYGRIENGVIAFDGDRIGFAGTASDLPEQFQSLDPVSLNGRLVTPGLIDCHTHLVHGGHRAREFEMRLNGASYADIAKAGGGVVSTVSATRAVSEEDLFDQALARLDRMLAEGVTTVEIKSGYGLDQHTELKQLRVARRLAVHRKVEIVTTFLGAHAIPEGMDADAYIDQICLPTLAAAAEQGLVDMVDGFCETIGFSPDQIERVFQAAIDLNLPIKLHAEQLTAQGGASLAARYNAMSADHLEYATHADVAAMARSGVVAVLLPGAFYYLKETQLPPIAAFRSMGVPMALSTDCNPGSSPMTSLRLAMNMGAVLFGLTPEEALRGVTRHAAQALGFEDRGVLKAGTRADLVIWDAYDPAELTYRIGDAPVYARYFGGERC